MPPFKLETFNTKNSFLSILFLPQNLSCFFHICVKPFRGFFVSFCYFYVSFLFNGGRLSAMFSTAISRLNCK